MLEAERVQLSTRPTNRMALAPVTADMPRFLEAVRRWIAEAEGDDLDLLLTAVGARITASREQAEIPGSVSTYE